MSLIITITGDNFNGDLFEHTKGSYQFETNNKQTLVQVTKGLNHHSGRMKITSGVRIDWQMDNIAWALICTRTNS